MLNCEWEKANEWAMENVWVRCMRTEKRDCVCLLNGVRYVGTTRPFVWHYAQVDKWYFECVLSTSKFTINGLCTCANWLCWEFTRTLIFHLIHWHDSIKENERTTKHHRIPRLEAMFGISRTWRPHITLASEPINPHSFSRDLDGNGTSLST